MSSLRIESLRLVWLETFVAVANAENISAAAKDMGVAQSTVSRNMQALQKWLGKTLIEPGTVHDPKDAGINVGLTDDGRRFVRTAERIARILSAHRTEEAKCAELLDDMDGMIAKMVADLESKHPSQAAEIARAQIEWQAQVMAVLHEGAPLSRIENAHQLIRRFFADYELALRRETRRGRGGKQPRPLVRIDSGR